VLVVARDQIFIGAAVAEASALGIAVGLWSGTLLDVHHLGWLGEDSFLSLLAVVFAILAALLTARQRHAGGESHEAVSGWVFLMAASGAILLVTHSPHGLAEVQRVLSSSIIGATATDVWTFAGLAGLTIVVTACTYRRVLLFAMDPAMATAAGMRVTFWAGGAAVWLGLAVGLSMRVSGMLYTFGSLVLPALVAKNFCREAATIFLVAPGIAMAMGTVGFVLANYYDYPPAQMTVALLSLLLLVVWGVQWLRGR
jgi:ABC-type Mn2+/Zn2+ transport system permease subunit